MAALARRKAEFPFNPVEESMSHTPGPWEREHFDRDYKKDKPIGVFGGAHEVASCKQMHPQDDRAASDAQLIAASPDLLACCKWLLDYAPTPSDADRVRAAIDKAEGST
jgi:hypothetical protein